MFTLHPKLRSDTIFIKDLELCQVLLMDNCCFPWLILVPRQQNKIELIDLDVQDQHRLTDEIVLVSNMTKKLFSPDKLNIATLGNQVSQLHIHVIARFKNDIAWPNPVWGYEKKRYDEAEKKKIMTLFLNYQRNT